MRARNVHKEVALVCRWPRASAPACRAIDIDENNRHSVVPSASVVQNITSLSNAREADGKDNSDVTASPPQDVIALGFSHRKMVCVTIKTIGIS
ncbi:unnamed protein product, partial [Iphiclides podalirius]